MVEAAMVALLAVVALAVAASAAPLPLGKQKPLSQREVEEIARKLTDELVQEVTKAALEAIKDTNTTDMNEQEDDEPDEDDSTSSTTSGENQGKENRLNNKETLSYSPKDDARTLITHDGFNTKRPDKTVMEKEHFFEDIHFPRDNASHTNQKGTGEHKKTGDTNEDLEESDSGAQQTTIINQKVNKGGKKSGDHDEDLDDSDSEFGKKKEGKSLAKAQPGALKNQKEISTTPVEPNKNKKLPLEFQEIYYEITEITKGNEARTTKSGPKQTHISTATANPVTNTKPLILIDNDKDDLKTEPMLPSSPANKWKRVTDSQSEYGVHSLPKCKNCIYGQTGKLEKVGTADPTVPVDYKVTNGDEEEGGSSKGKAFLQDLDDDAQEIGRRHSEVLSLAARARRNAPQESGWGNEVISLKPFHSAQEKQKKQHEKLLKQDRPFVIDADGDHIMLIPNDPLSSSPPSPTAQSKNRAQHEQHQPQHTHTPTAPSQQALIAQLQRLKEALEEERAVTLKQAAEKDRQEELEMSKSTQSPKKDCAKPNMLDDGHVVLNGEGVKHSPHSTPQLGEYMAHSKLDEGESKLRHHTYTYQNEDRSEKNSAAFNMLSEILHKSISGESNAGRKQYNRCTCSCHKETTRTDRMSSNLKEVNGLSIQKKSIQENHSGKFSGFMPKLILGNSKGEGNASFIQHMLVQTVVGLGSDGQLKADSGIVIHNSFDSASSPSEEPSFSEEARMKSKAVCVAKGRMKEMLPVSSAQNGPKSLGSDTENIDLGAPETLRGRPEVTNNGNSGIIPRKNIPPKKKESEDEDGYILATERPTALSLLVEGKFAKPWTTSINNEEDLGVPTHIMPQVGHSRTGSVAQRKGTRHADKLTTAAKDTLQDDAERIHLDAPGALRGRPEFTNNANSGINPRKNIPSKKDESEDDDGYILAIGRPTALSLLVEGKFGKPWTTSINDEEHLRVPTHIMPQVGHSRTGSVAQRNNIDHPDKLTTAAKDKLQDDDLPQLRLWHRIRGLAGGRGQAATAPGKVAEGRSSGFPQMTHSATGL